MIELLDSNGPFASHLEGFRPRAQQQAMAALVDDALRADSKLVVEAGTGVGKTFAYLAPAVLSGKKVVVSTGTKHLQDQLYYKDLPVVCAALGVTLRTALLKGRANYLCVYRLQMAQEQTRSPSHSLAQIRDWGTVTDTGDIAELASVPEDAEVWPHVTSTADNCLGLECPNYQDCHVVKARRRAQEADLVVINHHLFCADLALKEEGFGELLPSAQAFILDEAHPLPEIASAFFGVNLSSRQLQQLTQDTIAEYLRDAPDTAELRECSDLLNKAAMDLRLVLGVAEQSGSWPAMRARAEVHAVFDDVHASLSALLEQLESVAERGKGLQSCARRAAQLKTHVEVLSEDSIDTVQWFETFRRSFVLHSTPLEISDVFRRHIESYPCAWVFTSATLTVGSEFGHFTKRLGLSDDMICESLASPYDFANNALLYLPGTLPDPASSAYTGAVVEAAVPVLRASGGRAFLLFTSHRALRQAAGLIEHKVDYPLLVQGSAPRRELLERFREAGNAVLLGTSSFWEGVDVRGEALSCVIIDKLPFASPGDPVVQARIDAMKARGDNPFMGFQLPAAVIALKQGVGRLIRDYDDTGVLMICDPRLQTRPYGRVFFESLPGMPVVQDLRLVEAFFESVR
ncbi:MAG: ATP-dependent DNA helicase [Gammaproteobacteria bacterium]